MSYSIQANNIQTGPVASVRRRYFGPYKPCPRAQRVALMEKQESENTAQNGNQVNLRIEENIDFAVESSSKVDTNSPPVIEVDDENDDTEENVDNNQRDIDVVSIDASEVSPEVVTNDDEEAVVIDNSVETNVEENLETNLVESIQNDIPIDTPCTPARPDSEEKNSSPSLCPFDVGDKFLPQVVLERTPIHNCVRLDHTKTFRDFKTFVSHGYKLRYLNIVLRDCCKSFSAKLPKVKKYTLRESCSKSSAHQEESASNNITPNNIKIKDITCDVSQLEFIESYESVVARKLESLKKKIIIESQNERIPKTIEQLPPETMKIGSESTLKVPDQPSNLSIDTEMRPVHPRTRLRLSPTKVSKPSVSSLNYAISRLKEQDNYVELSDSDTESQYSITSIISESGVRVESENRIKSEDNDSVKTDDCFSTASVAESETLDKYEDAIKQEVKTEIKTEGPMHEQSKSYYIESDEELLTDILDAYNTVERRRRKISSNKRVQSFILQSPEKSKKSKPSLIRLSPIKPSPKTFTSSNASSSSSVISSEYNRSNRTNTSKPDCRIDVVKLSTETIRNLIKLCFTSNAWNDNALLEKAGMSWYDIHRLGIVTSSRQNANYSLRQFVKKNKKWIQTSTIEKPKVKAVKKVNRKALKVLKRKLKLEELKEQKKKEQESIRRALLKINARMMNQNKFWAFINQGSSQNCPIVL